MTAADDDREGTRLIRQIRNAGRGCRHGGSGGDGDIDQSVNGGRLFGHKIGDLNFKSGVVRLEGPAPTSAIHVRQEARKPWTVSPLPGRSERIPCSFIGRSPARPEKMTRPARNSRACSSRATAAGGSGISSSLARFVR